MELDDIRADPVEENKTPKVSGTFLIIHYECSYNHH